MFPQNQVVEWLAAQASMHSNQQQQHTLHHRQVQQQQHPLDQLAAATSGRNTNVLGSSGPVDVTPTRRGADAVSVASMPVRADRSSDMPPGPHRRCVCIQMLVLHVKLVILLSHTCYVC